MHCHRWGNARRRYKYTTDMNRFRICRWIGVAALALCCFTPAQEVSEPVDDTPQKSSETPKKIPKNLKPVAKAIAAMEPFNAEPDYKAKYYIYLESASWCGPCCNEMPKIVEAYAAMKKKKVEILLVGADRSAEAAERYLKKFNAEFPGVWGDDERVKSLPGYTRSRFLPSATFVDDKGKVIATGGGALVEKWEDVLFKKKTSKKKK